LDYKSAFFFREKRGFFYYFNSGVVYAGENRDALKRLHALFSNRLQGSAWIVQVQAQCIAASHHQGLRIVKFSQIENYK
jgi:hypothetical protein